jgi:hypothetical protein
LGLCQSSGILKNTTFRKLCLFPCSGGRMGGTYYSGSVKRSRKFKTSTYIHEINCCLVRVRNLISHLEGRPRKTLNLRRCMTVTVVECTECTLARCGKRYSKRYDTRCDTNATCIAWKHIKCTEAAYWYDSNTTVTSVGVVSLEGTRSAGLLRSLSLYTGQAEHDGKARGHIIDDFIHQNC